MNSHFSHALSQIIESCRNVYATLLTIKIGAFLSLTCVHLIICNPAKHLAVHRERSERHLRRIPGELLDCAFE